MEVSQGRGKDETKSCELYRVLVIFEKYQKNGSLVWTVKKEWHKTFPARKFRVVVRMAVEAGYFCG